MVVPLTPVPPAAGGWARTRGTTGPPDAPSQGTSARARPDGLGLLRRLRRGCVGIGIGLGTQRRPPAAPGPAPEKGKGTRPAEQSGVLGVRCRKRRRICPRHPWGGVNSRHPRRAICGASPRSHLDRNCSGTTRPVDGNLGPPTSAGKDPRGRTGTGCRGAPVSTRPALRPTTLAKAVPTRPSAERPDGPKSSSSLSLGEQRARDSSSTRGLSRFVCRRATRHVETRDTTSAGDKCTSHFQSQPPQRRPPIKRPRQS